MQIADCRLQIEELVDWGLQIGLTIDGLTIDE
jgi:hypothetical protein